MCFQSMVAPMEVAMGWCRAAPWSVAQGGSEGLLRGSTPARPPGRQIAHLPLARQPGAVVPALERPVVVPVTVGGRGVALVAYRWREDAPEALRHLARRLVARHQRAFTQRLQELERSAHAGQILTHAGSPAVKASHLSNEHDELSLTVVLQFRTDAAIYTAIVVEDGGNHAAVTHAMIRVPAQILARRARNSHPQQDGGRCRTVADK